MSPRYDGRPTASRSELRGLAYCPAIRPTLITGIDVPYVRTTAICSSVRSVPRRCASVLSANVSAQSPPCRRNASPRATVASRSCSASTSVAPRSAGPSPAARGRARRTPGPATRAAGSPAAAAPRSPRRPARSAAAAPGGASPRARRRSMSCLHRLRRATDISGDSPLIYQSSSPGGYGVVVDRVNVSVLRSARTQRVVRVDALAEPERDRVVGDRPAPGQQVQR